MQKSNYVSVDCKDLKGKLTVEPSKSMLHRYLICSFLSGHLYDAIDSISFIENKSEDILATIEVLSVLDKRSTCERATHDERVILDCKDSGSTLRMILPIAGALGVNAEFKLGEGLRNRPIDDLIDVLGKHGQVIEKEGNTIKSKGRLHSGEYHIPGSVSSQYVSGLLFALPLLEGNSVLSIDGAISSLPYIDMTIFSIEKYGVSTIRNEGRESISFIVDGKQSYKYNEGIEKNFIEGDWSSGAIWIIASKLCLTEPHRIERKNIEENENRIIEIEGLNYESIQGDRRILDILKMYDSTASRDEVDKTVEIDVDDTPDIVPAISLYACMQNCTTVMYNAKRLRLKECNRLSTICDILKSIGVEVLEGEDRITIYGKSGDENRKSIAEEKSRYPGTDSILRTCGDHRMIMLAAFTSIITSKPAKVDAPRGIKKSYPSFFDEIERLGGKVCR